MRYNSDSEGMATRLQHPRTTGPFATSQVRHRVYTPPCERAFEQDRRGTTRITTERVTTMEKQGNHQEQEKPWGSQEFQTVGIPTVGISNGSLRNS